MTALSRAAFPTAPAALRTALLAVAVLAAAVAAARADVPVLQEPTMLAPLVEAGELPPVADRMPSVPAIVDLAAAGREPGVSGGEVAWVAGRVRDIRIMNVYGYARLVGYDETYRFQPDILERFEVEDGRIFTFHLRPGHRWSDGHPFTTADFRYAWEEVSLNPDLKPFGPDVRLLVDGEPPVVEILDETTVRYSWSQPNPELLPALAGARPLYLYAPAHYLSQFHADHAEPAALAALMEETGAHTWAALHIMRGDLYDADNPDLPVLQPWRNTTAPPSERFVFERNPFYHRADAAGMQLPYLDRWTVTIADSGLIPAKVGSGEADLQARHLRFDTYTFLVDGQERNDYTVRLWPTALGSDFALYPNMNAQDPVFRALNRDVRFRRALSLAIDRDEINQVIYYGLATPSQNTALPASPLYDAARAELYARFDMDAANALLDDIGLVERDGRGIRLLSDGRPLEIIVETTGERTEETDILELIADTWRQAGIALYTSTSSRDIFRTRIFAGETVMSVSMGFDNAVFTANTLPDELAPVDQNWLQYPKWGQYVQTGGDAGEAPDEPFAERLMALHGAWRVAEDDVDRAAIITEMLDIHAEEMTSIGVVNGVLQPVVVANDLRNVPVEATYGWDPGAHFGIYRPDTFWRAP